MRGAEWNFNNNVLDFELNTRPFKLWLKSFDSEVKCTSSGESSELPS